MTPSDAVLERMMTLHPKVIDLTLDRARHFGQRAIDAIAGFPNGKAKAALIETVEFAIARGY